MPADQAAGLRCGQARRGVQVVSLFSAQPSLAPRLARALQTRSAQVLLIDRVGRHSLAAKTQSIFSWEQQVARQRVQPFSQNGIDIFHAPGAQAGDAAIVRASADYDYVLFDGQDLQRGTLALDPGTKQTLVVALSAPPETVCNAYALLKTLHENQLDWRVILWGDRALGERIVSATRAFWRVQSGLPEIISVEGDEHLIALAAKISATEIGTSQSYKNTGGKCAQHG